MATQMAGLVPSQLLATTPSSIPERGAAITAKYVSKSASKGRSKKNSVRKKLSGQAKEFTPGNNNNHDHNVHTAQGNNNNGDSAEMAKKKRRPRRRKKKTNSNEQSLQDKDQVTSRHTSDASNSNKMGDEEIPNTKIDTNESKQDDKKKRNRRRRLRNKKQKDTTDSKSETKELESKNHSDINNDSNDLSSLPKNKNGKESSQTTNAATTTTANTKKSRNNRKKRSNKKKFPWRTYIPEGAVDPISLDPLDALPYPPFALVIEPPYKTIKSFPPPDAMQQSSSSTSPPPKINHLHLFDGRVLAYYLISQLQFIDPLNRRDLTRPELEMLDLYLSRHNLGKAHVVKAYDCKGVTISTAGSEAQTASGQARILQEEATSILNALFAGTYDQTRQENNSSSNLGAPVGNTEFRNEFERQYMEHERRKNQRLNSHRRANRGSANARNNTNYDNHIGQGTNIDGDADEGMIIIDDDEFPGLRGGVYSNGTGPTTTTSYRQRNTPYNDSRAQENLFPSLQSTQQSNNTSTNPNSKLERLKEKGPSRSLKFISKTIMKTDPNEILKQRKAREEMQRRAALSQMSLLTTPSNLFIKPEIPMTITTPSLSLPPQSNVPMDGQIERNRVLAQALNVAPATARTNFNSGWARPIQPNIQLDEFGNELNATIYPESLILAAKEAMGEILRVEKRWIAFLADDKASFLNLRPMLKPLRKLIHEYSDFWNLHTESFDKDPKRYINCKKLRDTCAPYPLLSNAVRTYRPSNYTKLSDEISPPSDDAVGNVPIPLAPREFPPGANRKPLPLLPRSVMTNPPEGTMYDFPVSAAAISIENSEEISASTRFESLARERQKLTLEPRTIPLEMPSFNLDAEEKERSMLSLREKQRLQMEKKKERSEKEEAIIAAAFASDDEDEDSVVSHTSSEWSNDGPLYCSSEDEEQ